MKEIMMLNNKEYVNNRYQFEYIFPLVLLMLPYMGERWFDVFMDIVDPYTTLLFTCIAVLICNLIVYKFNHVKNEVNLSAMLFALITIVTLTMSLLINDNFETHYLFLIATVLCVYMCCISGITDNTIYMLGLVGFVLLVVHFGYASQYDYNTMESRLYNPNRYAANLDVLCGLSLFATMKMKGEIRKDIYAILVTGGTFFVCYEIYQSVTAAIVVAFLLILFLLRKLFKYKSFNGIVLALVVSAMVIMPITVAILIDNGNTALSSFLHGRGNQWYMVFEQLKIMDAWHCAPVNPAAHNGFYDFMMYFSIIVGIVMFVSILGLVINYMVKAKNNEIKYITISIVMMYFASNITESLFTYFFEMTFIILVLLSRKISH